MGLTINGTEVDLPDIGTFNLDEAQVVYDLSGLTIDQLEGNGGHPGVIKALLFVAVQRSQPGLTADEIHDALRGVTLSELAGALGDDADPPTIPSTTPNGNSSGAVSETSSALPVFNHRLPTGIPVSATSESPQTTSGK